MESYNFVIDGEEEKDDDIDENALKMKGSSIYMILRVDLSI